MRGIQICAYFLLVEGVDPTYIYTMQCKGFHVKPVNYIKSIQIKICSYLDTVNIVDIKEMKPI